MSYLKRKSVSKPTDKVFTNPSVQRFTCSALTPLESTSHYLSQLNYLLQNGFHSMAQANRRSNAHAERTGGVVMENKLPISLQTPAIKETGSLARVHLAAFKDDRCVRLTYSDSSHWKAINAMIEARYSFADFGWKLAVTKHEGRVVGWICCSLVDQGEPAGEDLSYQTWTTAAAHFVEISEALLTKTSGTPENKTHRDRRRKLSKVISEASVDAMSQLLDTAGGTKHVIINTLVVDPTCKGRGVGSELLKWVTDYADKKGIAAWAQVSTMASGLFEAAGFEEVHTLVLDLDDYYYGEQDRGKPMWGVYEIKYMLRKARDTPETV